MSEFIEAPVKVSRSIGVNWKDSIEHQSAIPISEIYQEIREPSDELSKQIEVIRDLASQREAASQNGEREQVGRLKAQISRLKKNLPMFTPSGVFPDGNKTSAAIRDYSQRLVVDIDLDDNRHLLPSGFDELKKKIGADPHVESVFSSPTGLGLKAIVRVPNGKEGHRWAILAVNRYFKEQFDVEVDASGKDVSRGCFLSADPQIITKHAEPLDIISWSPQEKHCSHSSIRHKSLGSKMGLTEEQCRMMLEYVCPESRDTWIRMGLALKHEFGAQGYKIWEEWSAKSVKWGLEKDPMKVWNDFDPHSITLGSLVYLAKMEGWRPSAEDWRLDLAGLTDELPKISRGLFNPLLEEYLELLAENQNNLPYEVAVCCFLGVLSFAIGGNKVLRVRGKWKAKGQLWLALVGRPGSGKTHIIDALGMDYLHARELQDEQAASREFEEANNNEDSESSTGPAESRRLTADSITLEALFHNHSKPVNQAGFGVHTDEILAMVNGMDQYKGKGNDKQIWLKMFNHGTAEMTTIAANRKINSLFVPLLGGVQPDKLDQLIGAEKQGDGFAARFLMCHGERGEVLSVERRKELARLLEKHGGSQQIESLLEALIQIRDQQTTVEMTEEAEDHFLHYEEYLDKLAREAAPAQQSAYSKLNTYTYRVALLLHYWFELLNGSNPDDQATKLGLETAERTTLIMEYFRESMLLSYGIVQTPKEEQACQLVMKKVRELGRKATCEKVKQSLRKSFSRFGISPANGYRYVGELIDKLCSDNMKFLTKQKPADGGEIYLEICTEVQK